MTKLLIPFAFLSLSAVGCASTSNEKADAPAEAAPAAESSDAPTDATSDDEPKPDLHGGEADEAFASPAALDMLPGVWRHDDNFIGEIDLHLCDGGKAHVFSKEGQEPLKNVKWSYKDGTLSLAHDPDGDEGTTNTTLQVRASADKDKLGIAEKGEQLLLFLRVGDAKCGTHQPSGG